MTAPTPTATSAHPCPICGAQEAEEAEPHNDARRMREVADQVAARIAARARALAVDDELTGGGRSA